MCARMIYELLDDRTINMSKDTLSKVDCISFIVTKDRNILVEKRDSRRRTDPNIIAIPGGHAMMRARLICKSLKYLTVVEHYTPLEIQNVYYYLCEDWVGQVKSNEAEFVFWLPFEEIDKLHFEFERDIINEYLEVD